MLAFVTVSRKIFDYDIVLQLRLTFVIILLLLLIVGIKLTLRSLSTCSRKNVGKIFYLVATFLTCKQ